MKIIPTKVHGYLDYIVGLLLIAAPWIFNFADDTIATYIPVALGIFAIVYSLLTDYELGVTRLISLRIHLTLDMAGGLLLAVSPWIFGFADRVYLPHLIVGIMEIVVALMTRTQPENATGNRHQTNSDHTAAVR